MGNSRDTLIFICNKENSQCEDGKRGGNKPYWEPAITGNCAKCFTNLPSFYSHKGPRKQVSCPRVYLGRVWLQITDKLANRGLRGTYLSCNSLQVRRWAAQGFTGDPGRPSETRFSTLLCSAPVEYRPCSSWVSPHSYGVTCCPFRPEGRRHMAKEVPASPGWPLRSFLAVVLSDFSSNGTVGR